MDSIPDGGFPCEVSILLEILVGREPRGNRGISAQHINPSTHPLMGPLGQNVVGTGSHPRGAEIGINQIS